VLGEDYNEGYSFAEKADANQGGEQTRGGREKHGEAKGKKVLQRVTGIGVKEKEWWGTRDREGGKGDA